jgi:hypothetical protein
VEVEVAGELGLQGLDEGEGFGGAAAFDTATARFRVTTGEGVRRSSVRIEQLDLGPVGVLRAGGAGVEGGDGGLDLIGDRDGGGGWPCRSG